jgi:predicted N-formylglutamate amidohydrolase
LVAARQQAAGLIVDIDEPLRIAEYIGERGRNGLLLLADHASNRIPPELDLGIVPALLEEHIAVDIGAAALTRALAERLDAPAILARFSRLVVDLNREAEEPGAIPVSSDGHAIPGNEGLSQAERDGRIARYWTPYHALIDAAIAATRPLMLVGIHSFTPQLASRPDEKRPWEVGILYNRDDRAAAVAIPLLRGAGIVTGDNEPYSGRLLNASMNRHAEARGLPYLGFEVRQDLIADAQGARRWADTLADVVAETLRTLASRAILDQ